jgi:hypothetical protein
MKDLKQYIAESAPHKLSATGKKKLEKQVNEWVSNIDDFYRSIGTGKGEDHWDEVAAVVWNFLNDDRILSSDCEDVESNSFVEEQIMKICDALEDAGY